VIGADKHAPLPVIGAVKHSPLPVIGAGVRPPDPGGVRPVQRHPEAVQRAPGARQAVQALRHEEVSEQCQQGDETPVPRPEVQYCIFQLVTYFVSQKE
jgi:hypothetical protein